MNKQQGLNVPDEEQIEEMLGQLKPVPSSRFHRRMSHTPWSANKPRGKFSGLTNSIQKHRWAWSLTALCLLIVVFSVMFIPSVRVIAKQIMYSFIPAPANQINVQVTLSSPEDLFNFSDPTNFHLSVSEAESQAGFPIKQISRYPEGMDYIGARFDPSYNAVTLLYQGRDYNLFLTQRSLGKGQDIFSIGESATVKNVMIGNIQGELVAGGWRAISTQATDESESSEKTININAVWDNDLPQYTLRWQVSNFAYEIRSVGQGGPSPTTLISLANELK